MKKLLQTVFLFSIVFYSYAQQNPMAPSRLENREMAAQLIQKSKAQRTGAILVGSAGTVVVIAGILVWADGYSSNWLFESEDNNKTRTGEVMIIAGTVVSLSSIPLFISSTRNRRKAKLIMQNENVMLTPTMPAKERLIGAGIVIRF